MKSYWFGKAVFLALLSVSLGSCDDLTGGGPARIAAAAVGDNAQARAFYEKRGWQAAWDGKSQKALLEALDGTAAHGLDKDLFLKGELPKEDGERDAVLTAAALRYASTLARGYSDPKKVGHIYTLPRPNGDVSAGLAKAIEEGRVGEWLESLAPQSEEYRALSNAFVRYFEQATQATAQPIPAGQAIKPGRRDARIPAIVNALALNGYLGAREGPAPQRYGPEIVAAVKRLQSDFGLKPDGIIGSGTLAELNRGPADRARQIAVNLERLRWLPRDASATRIDVNTAAAELQYWRDGRLKDRRNVVVGEPDWETPELASPMFQLVAHPYWRVPDSIMEDEIAQKSPYWLASQGMEWRNGRMVQRPGPKNALGEVKFDLRNDQHIYLHDTPAKALFATEERHRSHGCVRVEDALGFALLIASDDGILDKFQEALMKEDETFVKMRKEIPVRLMYRTAFLADGQLRLVEDAYGWDDDVARALGYIRPARGPRRHVRGADVGP